VILRWPALIASAELHSVEILSPVEVLGEILPSFSAGLLAAVFY
jgi:hypothetical protein